jgi:hypothetical protein
VTLLSEMAEQPAVLAGLVEHGGADAARAAALLDSPDVHHVVIAARGTSDNAARYAKYLWGSKLRLPVTLAAPSLHTSNASSPDLGGASDNGPGRVPLDERCGMSYKVHRLEFNMEKDAANLETFLNGLAGEVVAIIPNIRKTTLAQIYGATRKIDFLLIVERA